MHCCGFARKVSPASRKGGHYETSIIRNPDCNDHAVRQLSHQRAEQRPGGQPGVSRAACPKLAPNPIGGYIEEVTQVALAVEANGRIHALWTGVLNPYFGTFAFYSSSTDGVTWTPFQTLNYWYAFDPQIAVDDVHQRVHLMYRSVYDGIVHRTVTNGVVSAPVVLANPGV